MRNGIDKYFDYLINQEEQLRKGLLIGPYEGKIPKDVYILGSAKNSKITKIRNLEKRISKLEEKKHRRHKKKEIKERLKKCRFTRQQFHFLNLLADLKEHEKLEMKKKTNIVAIKTFATRMKKKLESNDFKKFCLKLNIKKGRKGIRDTTYSLEDTS